MTEDYKELVLKYITGNMPQEVGVVQPQFNNVQAETNDLYNNIKQYFSSRVAYIDFVPAKNNKNQDLQYSVLVCRGTLIGESDETGAYVILDKNYNIVEIITHYSDGSLIGVSQCMNVDDKGNYYVVEYYNNQYRIVLLNNLVLKPVGSNNYQAIIIDKHNIPNQYTWERMLKVFKNDGSNKYFVVGNRDEGLGIVGCELEIGDNDSWTYYTSSYQKSTALTIFDNGYNVYWTTDGTLQFQIAVNWDGLTMLTKGNGVMNETHFMSNHPNNSQSNFIFYSNVIGYYASVEDTATKTTYTIYKVNISNKTMQIIYYDEVDLTLYSWCWFFKNNNGIYFYKTARTENDEHEFDINFGMIYDTHVYEQPIGTFTATTFFNAYCYPNVITEFNKNYIYIQNQNTLFSLDFIWNPNNYNGLPFKSYLSLVPNTISIEDENEVELVNKNIYNLSNYSNWYTASVQIPNYFLNNVQLYNAILYSKANNLLTSSNINTTKNIYEELNINFTNKFTIKDNDTKLENISASSDLVSSMISKNTTRYIGKYKINYHDNTSEIKTISTNELVYNDLSTTIKLVVYINKKIDTIELISYDENTTYKSINCSDLDLNKYYLISQDIRIE